MLVVVAPAAALLLVVAVVATGEALALAIAAGAAVLAALVTLACSLVSAEPTKSTVLAAGLGAVSGVLLLLKVARVSTVALLGGLRGWQSGLARCSVSC